MFVGTITLLASITIMSALFGFGGLAAHRICEAKGIDLDEDGVDFGEE